MLVDGWGEESRAKHSGGCFYAHADPRALSPLSRDLAASERARACPLPVPSDYRTPPLCASASSSSGQRPCSPRPSAEIERAAAARREGTHGHGARLGSPRLASARLLRLPYLARASLPSCPVTCRVTARALAVAAAHAQRVNAQSVRRGSAALSAKRARARARASVRMAVERALRLAAAVAATVYISTHNTATPPTRRAAEQSTAQH